MKSRIAVGLVAGVLLAACAGPVQVVPQPAPELEVQIAATDVVQAPTAAPLVVSPPAPAASAEPEVAPAGLVSKIPLARGVLVLTGNPTFRPRELHAVDPATGLDIAGYEPITLGRNNNFALSPDGATLAVIAYPDDSGRRGALHLVDLAAWRDTIAEVEFTAWSRAMAFSPLGDRLALATTNGYGADRLTLVQLPTGTLIAQAELDFTPRILGFERASGMVIAYGSTANDSSLHDLNPVARVALFRAGDLSLDWNLPLPEVLDGIYGPEGSEDWSEMEYWYPAVALSPDGSQLYIVHADQDRLTTVDMVARSVSSVDVQPERTWLQRLLALTAGTAHAKVGNGTSKQAVLAADGARLYVTGSVGRADADTEFTETSLGLQVIEVPSGVEVAKVESQADRVGIAPDGERLFAWGWERERAWTEVLDSTTLETLETFSTHWVRPAFTLGGEPILLGDRFSASGAQTGLAVFDAATFEQLHTWSVAGYASWVLAP